MRAIVESAIARAGLGDILAARARRDGPALAAAEPLVLGQDLLVLGALADRIRSVEVGDDVRIWTKNAHGEAAAAFDRQGEPVFRIGAAESQTADTGLAFLRRVAMARIFGPHAARVQIDWDDVGLELAQVGLGFGASELSGAIASKRGLPIAEGAMSGSGKKSARQSMLSLKYRELAGLVERAGRRAKFIGLDAAEERQLFEDAGVRSRARVDDATTRRALDEHADAGGHSDAEPTNEDGDGAAGEIA